MLMKDPKKNIAMIISKKFGPDEQPSESVESNVESDPSIGYKAAADEIRQAIESKDSSALVEALKSFHAMCMDEPESEPEME